MKLKPLVLKTLKKKNLHELRGSFKYVMVLKYKVRFFFCFQLQTSLAFPKYAEHSENRPAYVRLVFDSVGVTFWGPHQQQDCKSAMDVL